MNLSDFRNARLLVSAIDHNHVVKKTVEGVVAVLKFDVTEYTDCMFLITIVRNGNSAASKVVPVQEYLKIMSSAYMRALLDL